MYQYFGNFGQTTDTSLSAQKVVSVTPYPAQAGSYDVTTTNGSGSTSASCWAASNGTPPAVGATLTNTQWNSSASGSCSSQGSELTSIVSGGSSSTYLMVGGGILLLVAAGYFLFHKK